MESSFCSSGPSFLRQLRLFLSIQKLPYKRIFVNGSVELPCKNQPCLRKLRRKGFHRCWKIRRLKEFMCLEKSDQRRALLGEFKAPAGNRLQERLQHRQALAGLV